MSGTALDLANLLAVSATVEPAALSPGERGRLVVRVAIPEGCHVQSHDPAEPFLIATELRLGAAEDVRVGEVAYPQGEEECFDWSPVVIRVYRGKVKLVAPVEVSAGAAPGRRLLAGTVRYQGCTESVCLMPAEQPVEAHLDVV